jgi:hypothetical protein
MMRSLLLLLIYIPISIFLCSLANRSIEHWLNDRMKRKWRVEHYGQLTKRQKDWYDNRQLFYECVWDMILGILLIWILIHILHPSIQ